MKIRYFVSYNVFANGQQGFGNNVLTLDRKLNDLPAFKEVKQRIEAELHRCGASDANVVILNFIELEDE